MKNLRSNKRLLLVSGILFLPLALAGCADLTPGKYVQVLTSTQATEMDQWRLWLGIIFGVELLITVASAIKLSAAQYGIGLLTALPGVFLYWTVLGEWAYRLEAWMFSWGGIGKVLVVGGSAIAGATGFGLYNPFLCGVVFDNLELVRYTGIPAAITGGILALVLAYKAVAD